MKLNSHYKFESTFSLNEIITSDEIHAIVSDAASQIAELQKKKRVEILEISICGLCTFGVIGCNKNQYPIHWDIRLNLDYIYEFISETNPGLPEWKYEDIFNDDMWMWSACYLNQVDFETLEYL